MPEHYRKVRPVTPRGTVSTSSFDITCVIGTVVLDGQGDHPHVAAMKVIGQHTIDGGGVYRYPDPVGGEVTVTVERETISIEHGTP